MFLAGFTRKPSREIKTSNKFALIHSEYYSRRLQRIPEATSLKQTPRG
jgi:hypothetical protein